MKKYICDEVNAYWYHDHMDNKWVLFAQDCDENGHENEEEAVMEIGIDEDGTYYWIEIDSSCGTTGYDSFEEARAAADEYFDKLIG